MPLAEVQAILARLSTEGGFRARFFADRDATLNDFDLTPADRNLLMGLSQAQVERFARSLYGKRRTEVAPLIPWAVAALGDRFPALFIQHCDRYHPTGLRKPGDDAQAFCAALSQNPALDPLTREVLRWEAARRQALLFLSRPRLRLFRCCLRVRPAVKTLSPQHIALPGLTLLLLYKGGWRSRSFRWPLRRTTSPHPHHAVQTR